MNDDAVGRVNKSCGLDFYIVRGLVLPSLRFFSSREDFDDEIFGVGKGYFPYIGCLYYTGRKVLTFQIKF